MVLLHGWPGGRSDYRLVEPLLADAADVVVPDLRGFGDSDRHPVPPDEGYSGDAQARSVTGLLDELGLGPVVLAGLRHRQPHRPGHRPAVPGARPGTGADPADARRRAAAAGPGRAAASSGTRTSTAWTSPSGSWTATGTPSATYLEHFWTHWSGPSYTPAAADLDRLADSYGAAGGVHASIGWYRQGPGILVRGLAEQAPAPEDRLAVRTHVLWPAHDPLFPAAWADRLDEFFADVTVTPLPDSGHFVPLEAPDAFAAAIREALGGS